MGAKSFAAALSVLAASGTAAQNTRPEANPKLEEVIVYGFNRDYLANKGQSSAVGLDLTQLETPAAISVISQDLLQDQQANCAIQRLCRSRFFYPCTDGSGHSLGW